ncbi:hypothetical protein AMTR_s00034p00107970 [Amborella trichopoda]|uniref:Uncharacterized protein n=1 Tax=Amborella trichopoda TaxID=13333 RepID=W1PXN2_AMBTC|nr:hypothetical protein AMTR_s00034p00107970 [Amborella trichopoda]
MCLLLNSFRCTNHRQSSLRGPLMHSLHHVVPSVGSTVATSASPLSTVLSLPFPSSQLAMLPSSSPSFSASYGPLSLSPENITIKTFTTPLCCPHSAIAACFLRSAALFLLHLLHPVAASFSHPLPLSPPNHHIATLPPPFPSPFSLL